jgi:uncharacterized protein (TIGR03435 family)
MVQSLLAERFKLKLHFENQQAPVLSLTLIKRGKLGQRIRPHSEGPVCPTKADDSELLGIAPDRDVWPRYCGAVYLAPAGLPSPQGANVVQKASEHDHMAGGRDLSMETIIGNFNNLSYLGRPIIDRTGLTRTFDFTLEWSPSPGDPIMRLNPANAEFVGITFPESVKEQLGMRLESIKAPLPTLIIDHIERPAEN